MHWRLNKIQYPVYNLGPGKRIGIWAQGCNRGCPECINPETWDKGGGASVELRKLYNTIIAICSDYSGITISGGEPFLQYPCMITFLHLIKNNTQLDTLVYTGYTLEELERIHPDKLFMQHIDYLIDGPYLTAKNTGQPIRGSANQAIYRFVNGTPTIVEFQPWMDSKKWNMQLSINNDIYMAGIPDKELGRQLKDIFKPFA